MEEEKARTSRLSALRSMAATAPIETQRFAAQTLLAMGGDERFETGKLVAAGLAADAPRAIEISRSRLREELQHAHDAAKDGAFTAIAGKIGASGAPSATLFETYFVAYFRKGQVLQVAVDKAATLERLKKEARRSLGFDESATLKPEEQKLVDAAAQKLLDLVCKNSDYTFLTVDDKGAFVNRAGQKFAFPTVTLTVAPGTDKNLDVTKIDEVQLVGDLTRIFWEAAYDWALEEKGYEVPFDPKSTACGIKTMKFQCVQATDPKERQDKLKAVNEAADQTEGVAGALAAQAVRGAWFASLDNEAIAKLLQTSISINARKVAEVYAAGGCKAKGSGGVRFEVKLVP